MDHGYEILEHTADVGIRAHGRNLPELFQNAARGMMAVLLDPETVRAEEEEVVEIEAKDAVELLVKWLHAILVRFDARGRVYAEFDVERLEPWRLRARLLGEAVDHGRHELNAEIKAVTYHQARVEQKGDAWEAQVFFDI